MRKSFLILGILVLGSSIAALAQARIILNGAKINIRNGARLVMTNPSPNAFTRVNGHLISEGENNLVQWYTGTQTGTYTVPWGYGDSAYLPLQFAKTAGTGEGYFSLATYHTGWQNSNYMPSGLSAMLSTGTDHSQFVADRFWRIEAAGYSTKPALSTLELTYLNSEWVDPNLIAKNRLQGCRWNDSSQSWLDHSFPYTTDTLNNKVTVYNITASQLYKWWILVDLSIPLSADQLIFTVTKSGQQALLDWKVSRNSEVLDFEIERSADAVRFEKIATIPRKNATAEAAYRWVDHNPLPGISYYRLKQHNLNATILSPIKRVVFKDNRPRLFPNPLRDKNLFLDMRYMDEGTYETQLIDMQGRILEQGILINQGSINRYQLKNEYEAGHYHLILKCGSQRYYYRFLIIHQ